MRCRDGRVTLAQLAGLAGLLQELGHHLPAELQSTFVKQRSHMRAAAFMIGQTAYREQLRLHRGQVVLAEADQLWRVSERRLKIAMLRPPMT
ncbi:hypothetical protein OKW42_008460 [Paraburkholderia sp. WC7.3d]